MLDDWKLSSTLLTWRGMRSWEEFRSNIRSEHDRYAECEHHLALEESQLRLQLVHNEGLTLTINDIREQAFRRIIYLSQVACGTSGSWDYVRNYIWNKAFWTECNINWLNRRISIMNFPANKQGDHHQVDHHMANSQYEMYMQAVRERDSLKVNPRQKLTICTLRARDEIHWQW